MRYGSRKSVISRMHTWHINRPELRHARAAAASATTTTGDGNPTTVGWGRPTVTNWVVWRGSRAAVGRGDGPGERVGYVRANGCAMTVSTSSTSKEERRSSRARESPRAFLFRDLLRERPSSGEASRQTRASSIALIQRERGNDVSRVICSIRGERETSEIGTQNSRDSRLRHTVLFRPRSLAQQR